MSDPVPKTYREAILAEFQTRLRLINGLEGFFTDVGARVLVNELPQLHGSEATAVAVLPGEDQVEYSGEKVTVTWPITVAAVVTIEQATAWRQLEALIADIKTAVETSDRTLGGLVKKPFYRGPTRPFEREAGDQIMGATITYEVLFYEDWGGTKNQDEVSS